MEHPSMFLYISILDFITLLVFNYMNVLFF